VASPLFTNLSFDIDELVGRNDMVSGPSLLFATISKPCIRVQTESTSGVFLVPPNLKTKWRLENQGRAMEMPGRVGPACPEPAGEVHILMGGKESFSSLTAFIFVDLTTNYVLCFFFLQTWAYEYFSAIAPFLQDADIIPVAHRWYPDKV